MIIGSTRLASQFARKVIGWQKEHGRNNLPWQNTRDPYKVWLSEIMLQQTQVVTVQAYYSKFLRRFPAVGDLASASLDDVLALWSGLGYYSRARNLHRCAQQVETVHRGQFPQTAAQLQNLPGIGASTAAAIASFCFGERAAILDGNVKRVVARVLAFAGDIARASNEKQLWEIARSLSPRRDLDNAMPRYTQGLMDLGATVCTLRKPRCLICPLRDICKGFAEGAPEKYPFKTRTLRRGSQNLSMLWAQRPDGSVWLERRPVPGIWGGLYCLPVFESADDLKSFLPGPLQRQTLSLKPVKHVLTHKDLHLFPVLAGFSATQEMPQRTLTALEPEMPGAWFSREDLPGLGLPAPIRKLLELDQPEAPLSNGIEFPVSF